MFNKRDFIVGTCVTRRGLNDLTDQDLEDIQTYLYDNVIYHR